MVFLKFHWDPWLGMVMDFSLSFLRRRDSCLPVRELLLILRLDLLVLNLLILCDRFWLFLSVVELNLLKEELFFFGSTCSKRTMFGSDPSLSPNPGLSIRPLLFSFANVLKKS